MITQFYVVIGKININGHIGASYVDAKGQLHKGVELLDVIEQAESFPDATELQVGVNSPGGYADVGDAIYDYLTSLKKKGKKIVTVQKGLVGSIATKIFLAGDERLADDRYRFWIHNPFLDQVSGDQDQLRAMADSLEATEKDLRKFYGTFTGITDEGLDGLMKIETGLTADQCLKFKFATGKVKTPVLNIINPKMSTKKVEPKKDEKSFMEYVKAFFAPETKPKGVAPKTKAALPGAATESKSLVVNLADNAGSFWVEGEALAEGSPAFLLDSDGQPTQEPLADGSYKLEDGSSLVVAGGKVSKMMPMEDDPMEDDEEMVTKAEAEKMVQDALAAQKTEIETAVDTKIAAQILALKKDVKLGIQPKLSSMQNPGEKKLEIRTIAQVQAERQKKRMESNFKS